MEQQYDSATASKRSPQNQVWQSAPPQTGPIDRPSQHLTPQVGSAADAPATASSNEVASQGPRVGNFPPTLFQLPDRSPKSNTRPMSEQMPASIAAMQHRFDERHGAPQSHVANAAQVRDRTQDTPEPSAEPDAPSVDRAFAQMPAADAAPPWDRAAVSRQEKAVDEASDRGFDSASRLWGEQRVDSPTSRRDVGSAGQTASKSKSDNPVSKSPKGPTGSPSGSSQSVTTGSHQQTTPLLAMIKRWFTNKGSSGASGSASTNLMLAGLFLVLIPCAFIFGRNGVMNSSRDGGQPDNASVSLDPKETDDINDLPATMGIPAGATGEQPDAMAQQETLGTTPAATLESPATTQERVSVKPQDNLGHQSGFQPSVGPPNGNPDPSYVVPAGAIMASGPGQEAGVADPSVSTAGHNSTLPSYVDPAEASGSSHSGIRYSNTPNGIEDYLRRSIEQR